MAATRNLSHDDRTQLFDALRRGIPPGPKGLVAVKVGRENEERELFENLRTAMAGGYAFRVITGNYGSGKTFLVELMRAVARSTKGAMLSMRAELSPERRFIGSTGQPTELWRALMSTLTTGDKGAYGDHQVREVFNGFVRTANAISANEGRSVRVVVDERLAPLARLEHGDQLAEVVRGYWRATIDDDEARQHAAVQWIRAGFDSKVDARRATGVSYRDIGLVTRLQLLSALARAAGWTGLFVCIDEVDKVVHIPHEANRNANYQEILRLCNLDERSAPGLAVFLSGASSLVDDAKTGVKSLPALEARLRGNEWVKDAEDLNDFRSTVLRLRNLSAADSRLLLQKLRALYLSPETASSRVPEEVVDAFLAHAQSFVGNETHLKPRETIKSFVHFMDMLDQNAKVDWRQKLKSVQVKRADQAQTLTANPTDSDDDQRI